MIGILRAMLDALPRPLPYLLRLLGVGLPLCVFIAFFMSVAFRQTFTRQLVFSLCIGLTCMLLVDGGRRLAALGVLRRRPDDEGARRGWPGWPWMLAVIALGTWVGIRGGYLLAGWILGIDVPAPSLDNWRALFVAVTVCLLAALGFTLAAWSRGRIAEANAQAERAQRAAAENQLKLLESQLEPHMLFNTLANLRVLIALDPPRAQAMLDRLIGFLRATLTASRVGTHALAAEFERLADYLALMQVRMGPRLAFAFELPEALRELPVPPLLLQPLVENSIAHGLEPKVAGGRIDIAAVRDDRGRLVLRVRDTGVGLDAAGAQPGTRFGLVQVRERLAALYGAGATFALEPGADGTGTEARIVIPIVTPPARPS